MIADDALQEFIHLLEQRPQGGISAEEGVEFMKRLGLDCCIACREASRERVVRMGKFTERETVSLRQQLPQVCQVETPFGTETTLLELRPVGPEAWEFSGVFDWPHDEFGLRLRFEGKTTFVRLIGPRLAPTVHVQLADPGVPMLALDELAMGLVWLTTGRQLDGGPYIGAGFRAQHVTSEAVKALRGLLRKRKAEAEAHEAGPRTDSEK